jgi:subtilisin family serine protease/3',5'-cyclic AMP phosphodiesterase CpdA
LLFLLSEQLTVFGILFFNSPSVYLFTGPLVVWRGLRVKGKPLIVLLVLAMFLLAAFPLSEVVDSVSKEEPSSVDFKPTMSVPAGVDKDHNGIEDSLDLEIANQSRVPSGSSSVGDKYVNVTVLLKSEPSVEDAAVFSSLGGSLTTELWTQAVYGFGGQIPYSGIDDFATKCSDVLLIEKEAICSATVAYAARQVGARPYVWNTLGLQGDPNAALAVLDTGIDASHVDFAPGYGSGDFSKKIVGWNNQVTSATLPFDDNGHGSHCSGLAAGDGFLSVDVSGKATATWSVNLVNSGSSTYFAGGMMVNSTGLITLTVKWAKTESASLSSIRLFYGDKTLSSASWIQVGSVSTLSQNTWYSMSYNVASTPSGGYDMYHAVADTSGTGNLYIDITMSWPYMPPSDGFSAWTGLAPDSKLVGVKVLDSAGSGTSTALISGLNWLVANRVAYHITVASMSLGFTSEVVSVDAAVLNLVNSGICTIVSASNSGSGTNYIYTPGSVDEVLTVAAMNQFDDVTSYSSQGGASRYTGQTIKPDITAPGGSFYGVPLFSADSNYNDAEGGFADAVANDAAPMQGTSMACPVVAGAAEIVVQAMGGYSSWNWTRKQALMPKTLLLMTATETYPNLRETSNSGNSPTLDRGGKDVHEGYGRLNLDAAVDAVLKTYQIGMTASESLGSPPAPGNIADLGQKLAWARNVELVSGVQYNFSLTVPSGADYDLYLYNITGNFYGEPVIVKSSVTAATGGFENIIYIPGLSGEYFVVVKQAREDTGTGQFTLTSKQRHVAGAGEDFTVVVLPDTQFYSESYPGIFDNQTLWIAAEAENLNILFVTHEGDIVNQASVLAQWQNANRSLSKLDDEVSWSVLPGNHDFASGGSLTNYNTFFGYNRFMGKSGYGGHYSSSNANNYMLFSGGGDDYLIFHFQYQPSDAVLVWANSTLAGFPDRKVIVVTHDYMNADATGTRTTEGNHIWNSFVAPHANQVALVLCGHNHGEAKRVDTVNGFSIPQLLADYQARTNGGNGYLRILKFSPSQDKIYVSTFSPYLNIYENDTDSKFELDFNMTGATENQSHLLLSVEPLQTVYSRGQPLTLMVNVLNQANPALETTLTLTVTGPNGYGYYDFQPIIVSADAVREYSFVWNVPVVTGTYVVEVGLVPAQLTAYDAAWLNVT